MAFAKRIIDVQFQLGQGDFGEAGMNTVDLKGLRCSAQIEKSGIYGQAVLDLRIWGMSLSMMNQLTVLNRFNFAEQRPNSVVVMAGDEISGTSVVFGGTILEAWADGRDPPDIVFHLTAVSALYETLKAVPPISYRGSVDAALVISGIATQMGYQFQNYGVTAQIDNPYYPSSLRAQLEAVCEEAYCNFDPDGAKRILSIWPKDQSQGGQAIKISRETGMVGYPSFTQMGVQVVTLYNPSIAFGVPVQIESQFTTAAGQWVPIAVAHSLESEVPGGQWFTSFEAQTLGHAA